MDWVVVFAFCNILANKIEEDWPILPQILHIDDNPWECDCHLKKFRDFIVQVITKYLCICDSGKIHKFLNTGAASVSVFGKIHKFSHWSRKCFCIFCIFLCFLYFCTGASVSVFTNQTVQDSFAFKGEREVVLHNRETEFRANKQQRGANLNKVTELEHKKSAPWKLSFSLHSEIFLRPCPRARSQRGWLASRGTSSVSSSSSFFLLIFSKKSWNFLSLFFPLFVFKETRLTFLFIIPSTSFLLFWRMTIHVFMYQGRVQIIKMEI